jgi:MFS family permease
VQLRKLFPQLLLDVSFRRFWQGKTISLFGDQITLLALPLTAVLTLHAGPGAMGLLTAAGWIPYLLIGLHSGAWVDRKGNRRKIMIVSDIARAILLLCIPVLYLLGHLSIFALLVVAVLIGIFNVFFNVSSSTLFVSLVSEEEYIDANALLNGSRALSFSIGPSIGGFLVQLFTAPITLLLDSLSFLFSALFLSRIHPKEPPPADEKKINTSAGLRYIWKSSILRYSLACVATINLFNYVFAALFILYVTRVLHVSPGQLGLILGASAFGSILGSVITGKISRFIGLGYTLLLGTILFPAPLLLVSMAGGTHFTILTFLFFAEFFSGLGIMILDISYGAVMAAAIPDEVRARVTGAWGFVNNGIRPLGALIGGALPMFLSLHGVIWFGAIGGCLGFLWLFPSGITKYRDVKDFLPQNESFIRVMKH